MKVDENGPNGCWLWTGCRKDKGYGQFSYQFPRGIQPMAAHRFVWDIHRGDLNGRHILRNRCGVNHCVNPDHWQLEPNGRHTMASRVRMRQLRNDRSRVTKATQRPTLRDLEWIAGFLEGEGCFHSGNTSGVTLNQVNEEPVRKLIALLGGTVTYRTRPNPRHNPVFWWTVTGARARGIMLTVYSLMSAKRKAAIRQSL